MTIISSSNSQGVTKLGARQGSEDAVLGQQDRTTVHLPGGEEFDYTAVLEQTFGGEAKGVFLDVETGVSEKGFPLASRQQWYYYNLFAAKEIDPISKKDIGRKHLLSGGLVADTTEWSDRQGAKMPAIWVPDTMHVAYLLEPEPVSGGPKGYRCLIDAGEWVNSKGEHIGQIRASNFIKVTPFRTVEALEADLQRVRAAVRANCLAANPEDVPESVRFNEVRDEVAQASDVHRSLDVPNEFSDEDFAD